MTAIGVAIAGASAFGAAKTTLVEPSSWYSSVRQELKPTYADPHAFNDDRKVGVGVVMSGATGLLGLHMHFSPGLDFSFGLGYGGASDLKAMNFYFRHLLTNTQLALYWTAGYARWWNSGGEPLARTTPPYLYERFLSPQEKATGRFTEHILYPGIGAQFYKMSGEWQGLSLYAEGLVMTDMDDLRVHPALGVGTFYYF